VGRKKKKMKKWISTKVTTKHGGMTHNASEIKEVRK